MLFPCVLTTVSDFFAGILVRFEKSFWLDDFWVMETLQLFANLLLMVEPFSDIDIVWAPFSICIRQVI